MPSSLRTESRTTGPSPAAMTHPTRPGRTRGENSGPPRGSQREARCFARENAPANQAGGRRALGKASARRRTPPSDDHRGRPARCGRRSAPAAAPASSAGAAAVRRPLGRGGSRASGDDGGRAARAGASRPQDAGARCYSGDTRGAGRARLEPATAAFAAGAPEGESMAGRRVSRRRPAGGEDPRGILAARWSGTFDIDALPPVEQRLRDVLDREPTLRWAYLFGSAARGEAFRDLDVAVMLAADARGAVPLGRVAARAEEAAAGVPVDVVDLASAAPALAGRIAARRPCARRSRARGASNLGAGGEPSGTRHRAVAGGVRAPAQRGAPPPRVAWSTVTRPLACSAS